MASRRWSRYRKSSHRTRRDTTSDETHEEIYGPGLDFAPYEYESINGVGHHSVWNGRFGRRFCSNEARFWAVHVEGGWSCTGWDICIDTSAQWQGISHRRNGHPWCNRRVFVRTTRFSIIQTDPLEVGVLFAIVNGVPLLRNLRPMRLSRRSEPFDSVDGHATTGPRKKTRGAAHQQPRIAGGFTSDGYLRLSFGHFDWRTRPECDARLVVG